MEKFGNFIDRWGLINSSLKGAKFSWSKFQNEASLSRLDHFLYCVD